MPASRLAKVLQEKAEALKRRRQSGERALREADSALQRLAALKLTLPEAAPRMERLRELARKSEWEAVELQAHTLAAYLDTEAPRLLEARRQSLSSESDRADDLGLALPADLRELLAPAPENSPNDWLPAVDRLRKAEDLLRAAETAFAETALGGARELAEWAGVPQDRRAAVETQLRDALGPTRDGHLTEAVARLHELLPRELPEAVRRREDARATAQSLLSAARELGVSTSEIEEAQAADEQANPLAWRQSVDRLEAASAAVADRLREKVVAAIESLRSTLDSLREYGADPADALVTVEDALGRVASASPSEIPALLTAARAATEEPVVSVVAGLLDEVRPRLVEARRLGRDTSEVFRAMSRSREALRLKIYTESLAASQEAIDRVAQLTADLTVAREEADALEELLGRLSGAAFPTEEFRAALARVRSQLENVDVAAARGSLGEIMRRVGSDALAFFEERSQALERSLEIARRRGFAPEELEEEFARGRQQLAHGDLAEAGETFGRVDVELRALAGPYVRRRVEEMEKGLEEIADETLVAPVRRLLADADVNLHVKDELGLALESLRRAERDFASVFAAQASALVDGLEEELGVLEAMGGGGEEIHHQIDEVQQIFNMGDFVQASRASRDIRDHLRQQELLRAEEALSHAKLALVELETLGLELGSLRSDLDGAQEANRRQAFAEAFQTARSVEREAARLGRETSDLSATLLRLQNDWQELRARDAALEPLRERIDRAKDLSSRRAFDEARGEIAEVEGALALARSNLETDRWIAESELLIADARQVGLPEADFSNRLAELRRDRGAGQSLAAHDGALALRGQLVGVLRPALEARLRSIERDLDFAKEAGVETPKVAESLAEAGRRLGLPVPVGATGLLDAAQAALLETRGFIEHAEGRAKRVRDALGQAELLHADTSLVLPRVARMESYLTERQSARVVELAATLEREIQQATYRQVSSSLSGFQSAMARSRRDGNDVEAAEALLVQARAALEEGRPVEALKLAAESETELERAELQLRLASGSLDANERRVQEAIDAGVHAPVAMEALERARTALEERKFSEVLEGCLASSEALVAAEEAHRRATDAIGTAEKAARDARALGGSTEGAERALEEARASLLMGDYEPSVEKARSAAEAARWSSERVYLDRLADVRTYVDLAANEGLGGELESARRALEEAEEALKTREWDRAAQAIDRGRAAVYRTLDAVIDDRTRTVEERYRVEAPPEGVEAERRALARQDIATARAQHDYLAALALLEVERVEATERDRARLEDRLRALKERLWVGEKLRGDTTEVMQLFSEARVAAEADRFERGSELIERGETALRALVTTLLVPRIEEVERQLQTAVEAPRVSAEPANERLAEVRRLCADGRAVDAAIGLLEIQDELEQRKVVHRELLDLYYLIDSELAQAAERRLDTEEPRRLFEESRALRTSDHPQALERAREAHRQLQELLAAAGAVAPPLNESRAEPAPVASGAKPETASDPLGDVAAADRTRAPG